MEIRPMWRITLKPILIFVCSVVCVLYLWVHQSPAIAKEPSSLTTTCKTDITWVKQGDNHWQSETGTTLKFYRDPKFNQVPSIRFWDGKQYGLGTGDALQNLAEAYALLAKAFPREEIHVTQQFRHHYNPWRTAELPPFISKLPSYGTLPDGRTVPFDYAPSPYEIHYLHRPANDWAIDQLLTHAQGVVRSKLEMDRDIYFIERGPFLPIFEGRFKREGFTLWFSTFNPSIHLGTSLSQVQKGVLSTPEMRLATWQAINDFFETCINADE